MLLASARLSAKSVSRYRRFGGLFAGVFSRNLLVAAQSAEDAERFKSIGAAAERTLVVGNVKFDLRVDAGIAQAGQALRTAYAGTRPVWIAGSTHAGEEEQVLDAHALLLESNPDAVLLLVPRHADRFAAVAELLARRGCEVRTPQPHGERCASAAIAERHARVAGRYGRRTATLYAVGGCGIRRRQPGAVGGHNLLEPAALGLPVLTGPSYFNGQGNCAIAAGAGRGARGTGAPQISLRRSSGCFREPEARARMGVIGTRDHRGESRQRRALARAY